MKNFEIEKTNNICNLVTEYLSNEGFRYQFDEDGDIRFKYQGITLIFHSSPNDNQYFKLSMPCIYEVENNRAKVLEAANTITREMKVLKAFLVDEYLWLTIEMFIDSTPNIDEFFERCCDILLEGRNKIARKIFE